MLPSFYLPAQAFKAAADLYVRNNLTLRDIKNSMRNPTKLLVNTIINNDATILDTSTSIQNTTSLVIELRDRILAVASSLTHDSHALNVLDATASVIPAHDKYKKGTHNIMGLNAKLLPMLNEHINWLDYQAEQHDYYVIINAYVTIGNQHTKVTNLLRCPSTGISDNAKLHFLHDHLGMSEYAEDHTLDLGQYWLNDQLGICGITDSDQLIHAESPSIAALKELNTSLFK